MGSSSTISATAASKGFSDLLSRVAAGETIEVARHGRVVAVVSPPRPSLISGGELVASFATIPHPDARFADDVRALARVTAPPSDPWRR